MKIRKTAAAFAALLLAVSLTGNAVFAAAPRQRQTVTYNGESGESVVTPPVTQDQDALTQTMTIRGNASGELITDTVYNILCMVVEAEVGSSFAPEAIKAQAVATHSYLLYHQNRGTIVTCPVKTPLARVKECVMEVRNEVLTYSGNVIEAVYCASSGGGTQSSADYWGGARPYLQAVDSPYDVNEYTRTLDLEYVREWFPESTFPEDPNQWFEILTTNSTGFVLTIRAGDKVLSGYSFTSTDHIWLRSNKIKSIVYNEADNTFTFTVLGNGHGVGFSQIGANGYAKNEGRDYAWILQHYYTGVTLRDLSKEG